MDALIQSRGRGRGPTGDVGPLPVRQEQRRRIGVLRQLARRGRDQQRRIPVEQHPLLCQGHGGGQQIAPVARPVPPMGQRHPGDRARHRDRGRAIDVAVVPDARPGKQVRRLPPRLQRIVGDVKARGCAHPELDRLGPLFTRAPQGHHATAHRTRHPRLDHAHRKGRRDRRVHRVAPGGQDRGADLGRLAMLRGDDAAIGPDDLLADALRSGEIRHGLAFRDRHRLRGGRPAPPERVGRRHARAGRPTCANLTPPVVRLSRHRSFTTERPSDDPPPYRPTHQGCIISAGRSARAEIL